MDTVLCEKFGWTYQELQDTPQYFIDHVIARLETDGKHQEAENKKIERQAKMLKIRAGRR